jgi:Transposase DDE domain group 1
MRRVSVDHATVSPATIIARTHLHRCYLHTVCRSFPKISSALSAKVCGGSRSAKKAASPFRRLAPLRRNGLLQTRTFLLLPTCPANGSTLCMAADRPAASCSTWIRTHGEQENSVWNGHYQCTCYHPLFVFNQFGDLERCVLRPGNVHSADGWDDALKPVVDRYLGKHASISGPMPPLRCRASTSTWKPSGSSTRSGCPPTRCRRIA